MNMQMQPIQASFPTQDQAEAAIRKLASLRGDSFRLENYMFLYWGDQTEAASFPSPSAGSYTLSANVPASAAEQARSVIEGAGGQIL